MVSSLIETIAVIPTLIFLAVIFSQYAILIGKREKKFTGNHRPSVSVLIPAHNEGPYIRKTIEAILNSGYKGKLDVYALDDGSTDDTPKIIKEFSKKGLVKAIRTNHIGKSSAMNNALKRVTTEIVITMDGDTILKKGSIDKLVLPFKDGMVAATTGVIKISNHRKLLSWFQRLEYLNFALFKSICERIHSVIAASGPLSAFRTKCLRDAGGFSSETLLEDFDVAIKLIKKGYKTHFVSDAVCYTFVPEKVRVFARQRLRWTRGGAQIIKMHSDMFFNRKYKGPGFYSLPLLSYWYFHSVVIGLILIFQIILGYYGFFYSQGTVFSNDVLLYFFNWFSVFGIINLTIGIALGQAPLTTLSFLNMLVVLLSYMMFFIALRKFGEGFGIKDLLAMVFMFPYWLLLIFVQTLSNLEWFRGKGLNRWNK